MRRRAYLGAVGAGASALAGCVGVRAPQNESEVAYQVGHAVTYDHDDLELRPLQEDVHLGETITFEVTNIGDSKTSLGCKNPWALQRRSEDDWRHVTWTANRYYQLCLFVLPPGDAVRVEVTLSESELGAQASDVRGELEPGTYRLLLLGPSPYLAVDFEILGR